MNIKMTSVKGLIEETFGSEMQHHRILLEFEGRAQPFDFYTGLGNVEMRIGLNQYQTVSNVVFSTKHNDFIITEKGKKLLYRQVSNEGRYRFRPYRLADPKIEDVLQCLQNDCSVDGTFENFCWEFGYDSDSISAFKTYMACQETQNKMRKLLGNSYNEFMELRWE